MGYRSNVAISVKKKGFNQILNAMQNFNRKNQNEYFKPSAITTNENGIYTFSFDWVKWYDGYEDVDCIMNVVHKLLSSDKEEDSCAYVRTGEDESDIQSKYNRGGWDLGTYPVTDISTETLSPINLNSISWI